MAARSDIDLNLTATESWENRYWVRRLLERDTVLAGVPFVPRGVAATAIDGANRYLWPDRSSEHSNRPAGYTPLRRVTDAISNRTATITRAAIGEYDIFHSGMYPFPAASARQTRTRRVITVYDLIPVLFPALFAHGMALTVKQIFDDILRSISPDDFFLCISQSTKDDLCAHLGIDPSRAAVTPLAASPDLFFPDTDSQRVHRTSAKYGVPDGARYLLSVNTLEPRKNMQHAIRCFNEMIQAEHIRDLYFVLVGTNGWQFEEILATVAHANLAADRVIVAGFVPDEDLASLYSGALAFVYPSFYEGFGLPPLEAMQCGTPVITSNTSSLPEVVGEAGIMVDPRDASALSQGMLTMYLQPAVRAELALKSERRARLFSWSRYIDAVVTGYGKALSG